MTLDELAALGAEVVCGQIFYKRQLVGHLSRSGEVVLTKPGLLPGGALEVEDAVVVAPKRMGRPPKA
jgi:hypothetical protein